MASHPLEQPHSGIEHEEVRRQRLVGLAYSLAGPLPEGMERLMWFGDSDTPMPVEVPTSVAARIRSIGARAGFVEGTAYVPGLPTPEYRKARRQILRILQPYIDAKYPTLPRAAGRTGPWWRRAMRALLGLCRGADDVQQSRPR